MSLLQKALILSILSSATAFADPCIVFKGISSSDFQEIIKQVNPASTAAFDHLYGCFENQQSARPLTALEKNLLAPLEQHLSQGSISNAERVQAYRVIESLESDLNRIDFGALKKGEKSLIASLKASLKNIRTFESLSQELSARYKSLTLSNRAIVGGGFSPDVLSYYEKTLSIADPKGFFADANQALIKNEFEAGVYKLYFKNSDFKFSPVLPTSGGSGEALSAASLKTYFDENFSKLSPKKQTAFIQKSVLYNPEFEKLLSTAHYPQILEAIKNAPKSYPPFKMGLILGKIKQLRPENLSPLQADRQYQALVRAAKNYYFNLAVREKALALLSADELQTARGELAVMQEGLSTLKNAREQMTPEEYKAAFPDQGEIASGPNCIPLPKIFPN